MSSSPTETEIKLAVTDVTAGRKLLRKAGFTVWRKRVFESNLILDTEQQSLRGSSRLLRLRDAGQRHSVTFKGPPTVDRHKSREELELTVSNPAIMKLIFERLGYHGMFRYDKYRTEYKLARGSGVATLDETPIGTYVELEGSPNWIDRMARRMGFAEADYITLSYGRLYLGWCERNGVEPGNMTFAAQNPF